jgi:hypothetical protein
METMSNTPNEITASVIPWERECWGVAVDYGSGKHVAYEVAGDRTAAEAEVRRIEHGNRPIWGPLSLVSN